MYDKNKDGLISVQEVYDTLTSVLGMKVTLKEVKVIVNKVDLDGECVVTLRSFYVAENK